MSGIIDDKGKTSSGTLDRTAYFCCNPNGAILNVAADSWQTFNFSYVRFQYPRGRFSSGIYHAPFSGVYQMHAMIYLQGNMSSDAAYYQTRINTSNNTFYGAIYDIANFTSSHTTYWSLNWSGIVDMEAGDSCALAMYQAEGTVQTDISEHSFWSGELVGSITGDDT